MWLEGRAREELLKVKFVALTLVQREKTNTKEVRGQGTVSALFVLMYVKAH